MSVVAELETSLQALLALKAPGITKSRIASITTLCIENVKSESVLVQKIYTHFKRAPATHRLGVVYVIDAITRQWIEKASQAGQSIDGTAQDGTFAAGVQKITELLPVMMNDLISNAPFDQMDKILKLVDIWERGSIFKAAMLKGFKTKIEGRKPPGNDMSMALLTPAADEAPIQTQPVTSASQPAPSDFLANLTGLRNGQSTSANVPPNPPLSVPVPPPAQVQPAAPSLAGIGPEQIQMLSSVLPPHVVSDPVALQHHLQIMQQLVSMNVPPTQWGAVFQAMSASQASGQAPSAPAPLAAPALAAAPTQSWQSPQNNNRDRSRSPQRRHDSGGYRQRSPDRSANAGNHSVTPKWTEIDPTLPHGYIRVLSRTLFIGGTQCNEPELREVFAPYGEVQTCLPNPEKRHAFLKYTTRASAMAAREALLNPTDPAITSKIRSVRWGVGFGPRDCNDYNTGISDIPLDRLTEADKKWVLTAPYGGTGGKPIVPGIVMEEPDIEIGAGVSSKAMSRRVGNQETNHRSRSGAPQQDRFDSRGRPPPSGYGMPQGNGATPNYGYPPMGQQFYGMQPGQYGS